MKDKEKIPFIPQFSIFFSFSSQLEIFMTPQLPGFDFDLIRRVIRFLARKCVEVLGNEY